MTMRATLRLIAGTVAFAAVSFSPFHAFASDYKSENELPLYRESMSYGSSHPGSLSQNTFVQYPTEYQEAAEAIQSEDYESATDRSKKAPRAISATSLAKQQLSAEEYAEAEKEVLEELEILNRFSVTNTTTRAPGFFKEAAIGLKNFVTAPLRAARDIFTRPVESLSSNIGSASITANKVKSAVANEDGSWKEVARDWWRLVTMSPERLKEAEIANQKAALEGDDAAKNLMHSDGKSAEEFGAYLQRTLDADQYRRQLEEERKSEEVLDREFQMMLRKGH